jgi:hypothetical protein
MESQVVPHGTIHDLTKEDQVILDDSILAAYNETFLKAGYTLASFESVSDTDIHIVGRRWYHWPPCWSASLDSVATKNLSDSELAFLHGAFEKTFALSSSARVRPTLPIFWIAAFVLSTILSAMRTLPRLKSKDYYRFCFVSKKQSSCSVQGVFGESIVEWCI